MKRNTQEYCLKWQQGKVRDEIMPYKIKRIGVPGGVVFDRQFKDKTDKRKWWTYAYVKKEGNKYRTWTRTASWFDFGSGPENVFDTQKEAERDAIKFGRTKWWWN